MLAQLQRAKQGSPESLEVRTSQIVAVPRQIVRKPVKDLRVGSQAAAAEIKPKTKPNAKPPLPVVGLSNDELVAKFALQHEKSISQWLFRAPSSKHGGPGSRAFKYSTENRAASEPGARQEAVKWAAQKCEEYGCPMPERLNK